MGEFTKMKLVIVPLLWLKKKKPTKDIFKQILFVQISHISYVQLTLGFPETEYFIQSRNPCLYTKPWQLFCLTVNIQLSWQLRLQPVITSSTPRLDKHLT